jgi:hypothetical protein
MRTKYSIQQIALTNNFTASKSGFPEDLTDATSSSRL